MKKKYILLGMLITIMFLILIGIFTLQFNKEEMIYVRDLSFYTKRATIIRDDIEKIKNETCKKSFNDMFNRINETHFTENVTIEKYYKAYFKDDKTFLNYYEDLIGSCELDEDLDSIYILVLSASNYPNEVKKRYLLSHEFIIKDYDSRDILSKNIDETGTYTTKALELQVINELLGKVKK